MQNLKFHKILSAFVYVGLFGLQKNSGWMHSSLKKQDKSEIYEEKAQFYAQASADVALLLGSLVKDAKTFGRCF